MKKAIVLIILTATVIMASCSQAENLADSTPTPGGSFQTEAVTVTKFGVYSETVPLNVVWGSTVMWAQNDSTSTILEQTSVVGEGTKATKFTIGGAGWMEIGAFVLPNYTFTDMSAYSNGTLSFMMKSGYIVGIGLKSGLSLKQFIMLYDGSYGFKTNNTWCTVNIPIKTFTDMGIALSQISMYFDVYTANYYGDIPGMPYGESIYVDNIYWVSGTIVATNAYPVFTSTPVTTATVGVAYSYAAKATDSNGDTLTYSLTGAPSGMTINASSGLISWTPSSTQTGSFTIKVNASDGKGGTAVQTYTLTVSPQTVVTQYPWKNNQNGTLKTNIAWNYTMGYHFTPQKSGKIVSLGGYFSGAKTVKIWNKSTGVLLAQAQVTSANGWIYTAITPLSVTAGTTYTVAVTLAGSGGSSRSGISALPKTYADIKINSSTYIIGSARPVNAITTTMYGMVDIGFKPN